jgi:hypothetical protein
MLLPNQRAGEGGDELAYADMFSSPLFDPEIKTPSGIVGPNGKGAAKRFNVYRNNVTVSLIEALASIFPAVQRITGPDFFRAMARFHVRETPPVSPLLFEYGREFPLFIEDYEYARDMPWLADTARIERAWLDAYHAADEEPIEAAMLAAIQPERLGDIRFVSHPATRIVRSNFSALSIFAANRAEGPIAGIEGADPEDTLITRPEMDVTVTRLPPGGAVFLDSLIAGDTLGVAASTARQACAQFDIAGSIGGMIEAGVFSAITPGEDQ